MYGAIKLDLCFEKTDSDCNVNNILDEEQEQNARTWSKATINWASGKKYQFRQAGTSTDEGRRMNSTDN